MDVSRAFDDIYNELITAHLNKSGKNAGLLLQIIYSAVAVLGWGIYKKLQFVANQIFPDTASTEWVEKHAGVRGITISGKTTDELLSDISDFELSPSAGGNEGDWIRWINGYSYIHDEGDPSEWTETVAGVYVDEGARGGGTINIVIITDRSESGYEGIATAEIMAALTSYIDTYKRVLGIWDFQIYSASHHDVAIAIQIAADNYDYVSGILETSLPAYMVSLIPGETLRLTQCESTAILAGALDANVTSPAANVTVDNGPDSYERIWPTTISIGQM